MLQGTIRWLVHRKMPDMPRVLQYVDLACIDCGRAAQVSAEVLERQLDEPPTLVNIASAWPKFKCRACGSKRIRLSDESGRLLVDPDSHLKCGSCGLPIIRPRLEAMPQASVCQQCAENLATPELTPQHPSPPPELSKCLQCGNLTVVRENSEDGSYFIGCTGFPRCRWTASL